MQTEILIQSIFVSLFTLSLYYLSLKGWPLAFYRKLIHWITTTKYDHLEDVHVQRMKWLRPLWKVLIGCPPCMCSLHGILLYCVFINDYSIKGLIVCVFSFFLAAGLNRIITQLI